MCVAAVCVCAYTEVITMAVLLCVWQEEEEEVVGSISVDMCH